MTTTARDAARQAITDLAAALLPAINATPWTTGVAAWRHSRYYETGEDQPHRTLQTADLEPSIGRVLAALVSMGTVLAEIDAAEPDRRRRALAIWLDDNEIDFLFYRGLTVNGWENLLKPEEQTGASSCLAEALLSYANPSEQSVQALDKANEGVALLAAA